LSLFDLLTRTSRTFALAIPLLPEGLSAEVGLAYLLFRVADTLEDAEWWTPLRKAEALDELVALLERTPRPYDWLTDPPTSNADYLELLARVPEVTTALSLMNKAQSEAVIEHVIRTANGMKGWVLREHAVRSTEELKQYCYVVAGIVGELLTELFCNFEPKLAAKKNDLLALAPSFGEGLQLVNVLKDREDDKAVGRQLIPKDANMPDLFSLARRDLDDANRYIALLAANADIRAFCTLPVELARATLDRLEHEGPGAKLTRDEVAAIFTRIRDA
jgi:farnesyl-diphosphate farnesyltransferase